MSKSIHSKTHSINSTPPFLRSIPPPFLLRNCCMLLALPMSHEIMDGFWCSRCLNDWIKVLNIRRLLTGDATTPLVVEIWTKKPWVKIENLHFALLISPEIMDGFWCSRCLNHCIKVPTWWDYLQVAPQPPWWWKFELNNPGWKLSICTTLIAILSYIEAKFN